MAYTKTTWQDGDIITSEKLNKIEQGIYNTSSNGSENDNGSIFYIDATMDANRTMSLVKNVTGQQILDAINSGKFVIMKVVPSFLQDNFSFVIYSLVGSVFNSENGNYNFGFIEFTSGISIILTASSLSENLIFENNGNDADPE